MYIFAGSDVINDDFMVKTKPDVAEKAEHYDQHRCKKRFFTFLFLPCFFTFFNVFFIFVNFLFFGKRSLKIPSRTFSRTFETQKLINRSRIYYESCSMQSSSIPVAYSHITLSNAYSDTAAVTSCSRRSK